MNEHKKYYGISVLKKAIEQHERVIAKRTLTGFLEFATAHPRRVSFIRKSLESFCRWLMDKLDIREEW